MIRLLCQHNDLQQCWRKLILHRSARSDFICNLSVLATKPWATNHVHSLQWVKTHSSTPISPSRLHFPRVWPATNLLFVWPSRRNRSLSVISQSRLWLLCLMAGPWLPWIMAEYRRSEETPWHANLSRSLDLDHRYMAGISVISRWKVQKWHQGYPLSSAEYCRRFDEKRYYVAELQVSQTSSGDAIPFNESVRRLWSALSSTISIEWITGVDGISAIKNLRSPLIPQFVSAPKLQLYISY